MLDGMLKPGEKLNSEKGVQYTVREMLGAGGQGEVYRIDSPNGPMALKWYYKQTSTENQKKIISDLVEDGSPSPQFLWPVDFINSKSNNTFGYVMGLRPREYRNIPDLLNRRVQVSFDVVIKAVYNMVEQFEILHREGYSYKDISDQNVFFHPQTGDILICDNDNVSKNNQDDSGVYGTMRYMAPEIVRGEKGVHPSTKTDLYSMAVLMFCMMFISHPLDGATEAGIHALDDAANRALYGTKPVFIYDPVNKKNRPVKGIHDNALLFWEIYPSFLKDKFIIAFTKGLFSPAERIVEREWKDTLISLMNSTIICPYCGAEVFYDEKKEENRTGNVCWHCRSSIQKPSIMQIGRHMLPVSSSLKIKSHHLNNDYDLSTIEASVSQNPKNPSQKGLKNEGHSNWTYIRNDGTQQIVPPGRSAALVPGIKINFGNITGEFKN